VFGVGLAELAVIIVIGLLVFGPDRLPEFARQAGRVLRQVRTFTQSARDDIRSELGPEFADFELTDLDPRRAVRKYMQDTWDETPERDGVDGAGRGPGAAAASAAALAAKKPAGHRPLDPGERPPYDADAT
jgi:sec-independent protein translocase protein TatB